MHLFLTMANPMANLGGEYRIPSYLLPWGNGNILSTILGELLSDRTITDVVLIANKADEPFSPHIYSIMRHYNVRRENLLLINSTSGQPATALIGINYFEEQFGVSNLPVVIHNADTILTGRSLRDIEQKLANSVGYVDIFRSNNRQYSYVLLSENREVVEIAEKSVISELATSGFYAFQSPKIYRENYHADTDRHISSVYKRMLQSNLTVIAGPTYSENKTIVVSDPDDYMNGSFLLS